MAPRNEGQTWTDSSVKISPKTSITAHVVFSVTTHTRPTLAHDTALPLVHGVQWNNYFAQVGRSRAKCWQSMPEALAFTDPEVPGTFQSTH